VRVRSWGGRLLDALYPRECALCGCGIVRGGACFYLCLACEESLPWIASPYCDVCGVSFSGMIEGRRICSQCVDLEPAFSQGRALLQLKGSGRELVHVLKYAKGEYLASDLGRLLSNVEGFEAFLRGSVLVPVPLFSKKESERGYNQSSIIARAWASQVQNCEICEILLRKRATPSQTGLSRVDRIDNVKNAFAIRKKALLDPETRYILVDDVFTTGSTLNACAQVLRDAGALSVGVAVLSHG